MTVDLHRLMREKGLSQKVIQNILGCSQPYISQIERFERPLTEEYYNLLVMAFDDISEYVMPDKIVKYDSDNKKTPGMYLCDNPILNSVIFILVLF